MNIPHFAFKISLLHNRNSKQPYAYTHTNFLLLLWLYIVWEKKKPTLLFYIFFSHGFDRHYCPRDELSCYLGVQQPIKQKKIILRMAFIIIHHIQVFKTWYRIASVMHVLCHGHTCHFGIPVVLVSGRVQSVLNMRSLSLYFKTVSCDTALYEIFTSLNC